MERRHLFYLLPLVIFLTPLFSGPLWATDTYFWIGAGAGNWEDAANWRNLDTGVNGELPVADSDVMIDGNVTVTLSSAITTESIQLSGGATLIVAAGGSISTTEGGLNGSNSIRLDEVTPYNGAQYSAYLNPTNPGGPSALIVYGSLSLDNDDANGSGLYIAGATSMTIANTGSVYITNSGAGSPAEAIVVRNGGQLTNNGTLTVLNGGTDGLRTTSGGNQDVVFNNGVFTISGGNTGLNLGSGWVQNYGTVTISGVSGKILDGDGNFTNHGIFGGNGTVGASDFFPQPGSVISPGASVGTLTFDSGMDFSDVTFNIEINAANSYDRVIVQGVADIANANLSLSGAYTPVSGDNFLVVYSTIDQVSGDFGGGPFMLNGVQMTIDPLNDGVIEFGAAFPVRLTQFTAQGVGQEARLSWATAVESNNDYFSIEHSTDGKHFTEVGRIGGAGTSLEEHHYSFVHQFPEKGLNYYRLDQHDFDGSHEYSDIESVVFESDHAWSLRPSLARDFVAIEWKEATAGRTTVEVFSLSGRKVYGQVAPEGAASLQISVANLPPGPYWVLAPNHGEVVAQQFLKE